MELLKVVCDKIVLNELIDGFSFLHSRAVLCFCKHKELDLSKFHLIMGENKKLNKKIINDLADLGLVKNKAGMFFIKNEFEALHKLMRIAERNERKKLLKEKFN